MINSSWIVIGPWERGSDSQVLLPLSFINEMTRTNIIEAEKKGKPHGIICLRDEWIKNKLKMRPQTSHEILSDCGS